MTVPYFPPLSCIPLEHPTERPRVDQDGQEIVPAAPQKQVSDSVSDVGTSQVTRDLSEGAGHLKRLMDRWRPRRLDGCDRDAIRRLGDRVGFAVLPIGDDSSRKVAAAGAR